MHRGRGGQADLDAVKVLERLAPLAGLGGGVPTVALVGDDHVKGVDGNVEQRGIRLVVRIACTPIHPLGQPKEIDAHALDGADVDKGVGRVGIGEIGRGKELGIKLGVIQILTAEALAVDLVYLVEFQVGLGLEARKGHRRLGGKRAAIDQKEDTAGEPRFHQAVEEGDGDHRLARAGGHRQHDGALALKERSLDAFDRVALVGAEDRVIDRMGVQPFLSGIPVAVEHLAQRGWSVEPGDLARAAMGVAQILEPDDLAGGVVDEGNAVAVKVERAGGKAAGVALGLLEHVLRPHAQPLGLDDGQGRAVFVECIVGGAGGGGMLLEDDEVMESMLVVWQDGRPSGLGEGCVDQGFSGSPFGKRHRDASDLLAMSGRSDRSQRMALSR